MVEENTGFCIKCHESCIKYHKLLIFILNLILFITGVCEVGISVHHLAVEADSAEEFATDVLGDDIWITSTLFCGVVVICLSLLGCIGFKRKNKCMIWMYAFIFIFAMLSQAMVMGITSALFMYSKAIYGSLWQELDNVAVINIEKLFKCCSFNGTDTENTWPGDAAEYANCTSTYFWNPMDTCWEKFGTTVTANHHNLEHLLFLLLVIQVFVCVSKLILIRKLTATKEITTEDVGDAEKPLTANTELTIV